MGNTVVREKKSNKRADSTNGSSADLAKNVPDQLNVEIVSDPLRPDSDSLMKHSQKPDILHKTTAKPDPEFLKRAVARFWFPYAPTVLSLLL